MPALVHSTAPDNVATIVNQAAVELNWPATRPVSATWTRGEGGMYMLRHRGALGWRIVILAWDDGTFSVHAIKGDGRRYNHQMPLRLELADIGFLPEAIRACHAAAGF